VQKIKLTCCNKKLATDRPSQSFGTGTGFGSGSNMKCHKKKSKIKNERPTFWEIMLLLTLKKKIFYKFFVVGKLC
jgi:hypothetical protein